MATPARILTPIGNSVDAYRSRWLAEKSAHYEHLWRLIHIQEAVVVSLGACVATRLLALWSADAEMLPQLNKLRSLLTGYSDDDENFNEKRTAAESCFSGSINAWVNLLSWVARSVSPNSNCEYVKAVGSYLTMPPPQNRELAFLPSFRGISPNVSAYEAAELPRIRRFEAINVLRNKIAHVPLPYEQLQPLHLGLQREVFSALHEDYRPENTDLNSVKWFSVLRGKLATRACIINGSEKTENTGIEVGSEDGVIFESGLNSELRWAIAPFIRPNAELKVSVLFRVPDFDPTEERLKIEYHRFAAESNAVKEENLAASCLRDWHLQKPPVLIPVEPVVEATAHVPEPENVTPTFSSDPAVDAPTPTPRIESAEPERTPIIGPFATKSAAINAFRVGDFDYAIELLLKVKSEYSHMWNDAMAQKLGQAYLRHAVEDFALTDDERRGFLDSAETYLKASLRHRDEEYQAAAHYELSKVAYRRFKLNRDAEFMRKAKEEIEAALQLVAETRFLTWLEYLEREDAS
jgi:hypothetical protein